MKKAAAKTQAVKVAKPKVKPAKQNRFKTFFVRFGVFVAALACVTLLYFASGPGLSSLFPSQPPTAKTQSIEQFLSENFFNTKVYRPKQTQPSLPPQPLAPVIGRIETNEPVVFITIDDGLYEEPEALYMLYKRGLSATLFLNDSVVKDQYSFYNYWRRTGSTIQNHTINHPHLMGMTYDQQRLEICPNSDRFEAAFGVLPTLFRAPHGEADDNTRKVVADCGMKAVVWWSVVVENQKIHYQYQNTQLRPGDIVLFHFTPHLSKDFEVFFKQLDAQGLQVGQLEDWLH